MMRAPRHTCRRSAAAALAAAAAFSVADVARAEDYPWCLVYQEMTGAVSCAFTSYEQCRMSTGGNAGFCTENPFYRPKVTAAPRTRSRAHR